MFITDYELLSGVYTDHGLTPNEVGRRPTCYVSLLRTTTLHRPCAGNGTAAPHTLQRWSSNNGSINSNCRNRAITPARISFRLLQLGDERFGRLGNNRAANRWKPR
jgi:hypothetical protein